MHLSLRSTLAYVTLSRTLSSSASLCRVVRCVSARPSAPSALSRSAPGSKRSEGPQAQTHCNPPQHDASLIPHDTRPRDRTSHLGKFTLAASLTRVQHTRATADAKTHMTTHTLGALGHTPPIPIAIPIAQKTTAPNTWFVSRDSSAMIWI